MGQGREGWGRGGCGGSEKGVGAQGKGPLRVEEGVQGAHQNGTKERKYSRVHENASWVSNPEPSAPLARRRAAPPSSSCTARSLSGEPHAALLHVGDE